MRLTDSMKADPTSFNMHIFNDLVSRAMEITDQMSKSYQEDRYSSDRVQEAIDITYIQNILKDRPAKSTQDLIIPAGNKVSHRTKIDATVFESLALKHHADRENLAICGLGHNFGGGTKIPIANFAMNLAQGGGERGYPDAVESHTRCVAPRDVSFVKRVTDAPSTIPARSSLGKKIRWNNSFRKRSLQRWIRNTYSLSLGRTKGREERKNRRRGDKGHLSVRSYQSGDYWILEG